MPVHNALPHLDEAIESILKQSFTDFEFVILDDGSTDGSTGKLREWASRDPRIRLIESSTNLGPALSSDRVARAASAPIVARMDADDISYPDRLAEQYALLENNPDADLVASLSDVIDASGRRLRKPEAWRLARRSVFVPFAHGAIMYRKALFEAVGGYRRECEYWEDQDLITRMAAATTVLVIPHALYRVRQSQTSTRVASTPDRLEHALDLMYRCIARLDRSQGYDDLLRSNRETGDRLDPRVFISLGSVMLWAGRTPHLFKRLLRRGRLAFDLRSLTALVWTGWASASPGSLRSFLLFLLTSRNSLASARLSGGGPVKWSPSPSSRPSTVEREEAA